MKLTEIAGRIRAHLERFEADPEINVSRTASGNRSYFRANSWAAGRWVYVKYIAYHNESNLSKAEAEEYLAWLDAGNVGTHYRMETAKHANKSIAPQPAP